MLLLYSFERHHWPIPIIPSWGYSSQMAHYQWARILSYFAIAPFLRHKSTTLCTSRSKPRSVKYAFLRPRSVHWITAKDTVLRPQCQPSCSVSMKCTQPYLPDYVPDIYLALLCQGNKCIPPSCSERWHGRAWLELAWKRLWVNTRPGLVCCGRKNSTVCLANREEHNEAKAENEWQAI